MKKAIGMFAALMVALAMTGTAYALWSKALFIEGYVETGTVNAEFVYAFTDDDESVDDPAKDSLDDGLDPAASGIDPKDRYDKNVAYSEAYINDEDPQIAYVNIYNAYPSYYTTAWFDIVNTGSIPVKIQSVLINGIPVMPSEPTGFDLDDDGDTDVTIHVSEITIGLQIDPWYWNEEVAQMDLDIHVEQGAKQNSNYYFEVEILLVQWNEYVPPLV